MYLFLWVCLHLSVGVYRGVYLVIPSVHVPNKRLGVVLGGGGVLYAPAVCLCVCLQPMGLTLWLSLCLL